MIPGSINYKLPEQPSCSTKAVIGGSSKQHSRKTIRNFFIASGLGAGTAVVAKPIKKRLGWFFHFGITSLAVTIFDF